MAKKLEEIISDTEECNEIRRITKIFNGRIVAILDNPIPMYGGVNVNEEDRIFKR